MFDIGFSELILVLMIGLVVLGPERLPVAVRTIAGWIRAMRTLAASVQNELTQELKLQELQESLKKAEKSGLQNLSPELKASMDELKSAAESMKKSYSSQLDELKETTHLSTASESVKMDVNAITNGSTANVNHVTADTSSLTEKSVETSEPEAYTEPTVNDVKHSDEAVSTYKPGNQ